MELTRKHLWSSSVRNCLVGWYQLFILTIFSSLHIFLSPFLLHSFTVTSSLTKQPLLGPLVLTMPPSPNSYLLYFYLLGFVFISFFFFYFTSFLLLPIFLLPLTLHFLPLASTLIKQSIKNF